MAPATVRGAGQNPPTTLIRMEPTLNAPAIDAIDTITIIISESAATTARPAPLLDAVWIIVLVLAVTLAFLLAACLPKPWPTKTLMAIAACGFPAIAAAVVADAGPFDHGAAPPQRVVSAALDAALDDYPGAIVYDHETATATLIDPTGAKCEYSATVTMPASGAHGIASLHPKTAVAEHCDDNFVGPDLNIQD